MARRGVIAEPGLLSGKELAATIVDLLLELVHREEIVEALGASGMLSAGLTSGRLDAWLVEQA